jgi:hypothetical protein
MLVFASATAAGAAPKTNVNAPVDEYFGPLKMSSLRIRLRVDQLGARYHQRTESDDDLVHDAGDVRVSLEDWLRQYPRDSWGPPTVYHLAQLYAEIQTPQARALAKSVFTEVATRFPKTSYGHLARVRLAQGFPPLRAESPVVASPAPVPVATAAPSATAVPSATAAPSATP